MVDYIIATDATIDLDRDTINELDVHVIPMHFCLDGTEYTYDPSEGEFDFDGFYRKLDTGAGVSTTQITPTLYYSYFEKLLKFSKKIIYICFSSGLSGTFGAANIAVEEIKEQYPDAEIQVIDSLCASIGEGLLVMKAARERLKGMDFNGLVEYILNHRRRICHWFVVGNLEQLKRGGRIPSIEAAIGTILNIHPIVSTDEEGRLTVVSKVRGMKKAVQTLFEKVKEKGQDLHNQTIILAHAGEKKNVELLKSLIEEENLVKECKLSEIGPVIGSHTGAPMCAVTFEGDTSLE